MKGKSVITLFLFITACVSVQAQDRTFRVNLEGALYDSLYFTGVDIHERQIIIRAQKESDFTWAFVIPDSIWSSLPWFSIQPLLYNDETKTASSISFIWDGEKDLSKSTNTLFGLDENDFTINARFVDKLEFNQVFAVKKADEYVSVNGKVKQDVFAISRSENERIFLSLEYPDFFLKNLDEVNYEKEKEKFHSLVKLYPGSKYLIVLLQRRFTHFKTKEEIEPILNDFSENTRNSFWGDYIDKRIYTKYFENLYLPLWNDARYEPIVTDNSKYNLVVFSASWCRPCHEKIPILKKLYQDLHAALNIIFVSIDEAKTLENWKKLMIKEEIPWRSLVAYNNVNDIKKKYFLTGVPHYILVYPDGINSMKEIDIDKEEDLSFLYNLCK